MNHVMVPVPEELVDDVKRYITWRDLRRPAVDIDPDVARDVIDRLDASALRLLRFVVGATDSPDESIDALAERIGSTPREIVGMVTEINTVGNDAGGPALLLIIQPILGERDSNAGWTAARHIAVVPGIAATIAAELTDGT